MGYYLVHKSNKLIHATTWVNLKNIILIERSHMQMVTHYLYEVSRKGKSIEKESILELILAGGLNGY